MRGACRQALLGKLLSAAVLFRGALHYTCSYMLAYLSTLDQNTTHECSTIAKLSAGAGVFYHKLQRSGKVVHEALIRYTCSHCINTCPEGVGVRDACVTSSRWQCGHVLAGVDSDYSETGAFLLTSGVLTALGTFGSSEEAPR